MKLLNKSILYFILVSVPVLIIAGIASFDMISSAVDETTREIMWSDLEKVKKQVDKFEQPQSLSLGLDQLSSVKPDSTGNTGYKFSERILMDAKEDEPVKHKVLRSYYKSGGTNYLITIVRPALEDDDLIENLIRTLALIIGLLIVAFFAVNIFLSKFLWKPYYNTIEELNRFDLGNGIAFKKETTSTVEFKNLNDNLSQLTQKMQRDFMMQKEFTENASHEMQTPLAVIKAKTEQLMQSSALGSGEMELLMGIENSINRLASLNKSLLLLAKIENRQFHDTADISVKMCLEKVLDMYADFIAEKKLEVAVVADKDTGVKANGVLMEILIGNLIQNAIRHNDFGGVISAHLTDSVLTIRNSGSSLPIDQNKLFDRFKKGDASKESVCLGLAIVRSIATIYNFNVDYKFLDKQHTFILRF